MNIEVGNIVKNLIPTEAVKIIKVQPLGTLYSFGYVGINSKQSGSKVLDKYKIDALEIVTDEGKFNFKGNPEEFVLFAEAERINSAYQFDPLFAINCSVIDPLPHQVEAVYKFLLPQPKIRFLLADDTGAGKTIMTGLLLKELMMRKVVERILIVTPGGLTKQWQEDEMGIKFNIPFRLANRATFSSEPTIFQTSDRIVTSIDFICQADILSVLEKTNWDIIVFDEAHKLSAYVYGEKAYRSRRYEAAYNLSKRCEHLLLLTATPHRGRDDTFMLLMQLLDEDIFATSKLVGERVKELSQDGINKFFIRRLKEDMKDWEGNPLYKSRHTKTVSYSLTSEEKHLYDAVTHYLTKRKAEASQTNNVYVSLALQVMQRRLASSIYAIRNTLRRRWQVLQSLVDMLNNNPGLWKQRHKLDDFDNLDIDGYDDLNDSEKQSLDNILSDPKKFKLFTTSKSTAEIAAEAAEVKALFELADHLYCENQEERKYIQLKELLKSEKVINGEKLVIFTEHKDTLLYLEERLRNNGYGVVTIHGGMSVDERRESQCRFRKDEIQILIATDAAGEGINLQFCRLLINWDIPWNPNRLEQRMGRIHRYGQTQDVMVFNMVADNTREGQVLKTLLTKLDVIREQLGNDRVYDVIQDVFKGVGIDSIIKSILDGEKTALNEFVERDTQELKGIFNEQIAENKKRIAHSTVDYRDARILKEDSDEKRLQPIYIRLFFERAFTYLGGKYEEIKKGIFRITLFPEILKDRLKDEHNLYIENMQELLFCFDKHIFLDYRNDNPYDGRAHYINPGNAVFDCLVECVLDSFRDEALKGTVLISPEDKESFFAFFIRSQIVDNRINKGGESVANELLTLVYRGADNEFHVTSPAKLLDLCPPKAFAKEVTPPDVTDESEAVEWTFLRITEPLLEQTSRAVQEDAVKRRKYLEEAFDRTLFDLSGEINDLQGKSLISDNDKLQEQLVGKMRRKDELVKKRERRLKEMEQMVELSPKEPEVLGCAYVIPLNQVEYQSTFGMSRDDDVEAVAMRTVMDHEIKQGRTPTDVSADNLGYDIRSIGSDGTKRYIEVKGRSGSDGVMLTENEMNRLAQLGCRAWLYIVSECKSEPKLNIVNDPAMNLKFKMLTKGLQFFVPLEEWQSAAKK